MNPHHDGVSRYDSLSYDEITESEKRVSSRDKNFWRIEYNFTSLYRIPGITAETLDLLSHKLKTNRSWFDIYFRTNNVNFNMDTKKVCPDEYCRRVQNCAISHVDYAEYQYCVERGDGFGGSDIIGLAYDVTSDASRILSGLFQLIFNVPEFVYLTVFIHNIFRVTLYYS